LKWLAKVNEIPGLSLTPDCIDKMPPVAFSLLSSGGRINEFLKVMDWFVSVLKSAQPEMIDQ
jgi:hypothetical protein